jgi:hypothetical protein
VDAIDRTILAAADYMQAHGWCQHGFDDGNGRVCILGALRHQAPGHMFAQVVERIEDHHRVNTVTFNDFQCKSKRQAVAFMRAAVKQQQGRQ